jgi:osomolarity two-component system, sensor histidine kinase NIK1
MALNLTDQVRFIASVTSAVAAGDPSQTVDVNVQGKMLALKLTVNSMVEQVRNRFAFIQPLTHPVPSSVLLRYVFIQLRTFACEVTRVALEVGTQGELRVQAEVEGVEGTWLDLTSHVSVHRDFL